MIKIKRVKHIKRKDLEESELVLNFSGNDINNTIINCLRRISFQFVPTYSFCYDTIDITKNTTIYNNDLLKNRLEQICIYLQNINEENNVDILDDIFWRKVDYKDKAFIKHDKDNLKLELFLDVKNDTDNVRNITTNDCKFFVNDNEVNIFDKRYPELLLKMKPKDIFSCRAFAVLSVGERSNIWSSVRNCFFEKLDNNSFNFTIQSIGQLDEIVILRKTCKIIKFKINKIKEWISNQKDKNVDYNITKLKDENHTIGELIVTFMQGHNNVIFCGGSKPDLLINDYLIKTTTKNTKYLNTFTEVLDNIYKLYDDIEKKFNKL
jgi:DNA-directed RNA polymerase subunit L